MSRADRQAALLTEDEATRRCAQESFAGALFVEAGAGTGKTSILVSRIVVWALGEGWTRAEARAAESNGPGDSGAPGSPTHEDLAADLLGRVAAITFTEAAAAEMAERTGRLLAEIGDGGVPGSVFEDRLPPAVPVRTARARALVAALDRLQVRTIHAFCRGLLTQYPLDARVHPGFQVDADELVRTEVVREVVETAVVRGYSLPGDPDWLGLAEEGFGPAEIEAALFALVGDRGPADLLEADPLTPERIAALLDDMRTAVDALLAAAGDCFDGASRVDAALRLLDAVAHSRTALANATVETPEALQEIVGVLGEIWSGNERARLRKWMKDDFSGSERAALGETVSEVSRCSGDFLSPLDHLCALAPIRLARARRVLSPLLLQAREELRRRGAASFDSLLRDARDLLVERPDVAARVRGEIDQLLVDEFQDTDPLQCEIVRVLALEGPADTRPGLFLVGDPKQSIYGWRNADLRAYDEFVEALPEGGGAGRLTRNFRSLPRILAAVEDAIAPVMEREVGLQPEFQPLVPARAESDDAPGAVEHWVSWDWDASAGEPVRPSALRAAELEAEAIARDLRQRHAAGEIDWRDAGILFRSQGDLEIYLQSLRAAGVPYAVERDRSYYRRREIIEASALVRCVLDRNDQVALLAWLRSASVGVPDAALLPLWSGGLPQRVAQLDASHPGMLAEIDALVTAAAASIPEDIPGIDRIRGWESSAMQALRMLAVLRSSFEDEVADRFVSRLRSLSLLEVTESARFLGEYRVANLDRFFRDLLAELESACDRETLLRRLRSGVSESTEVEEARPQGAEDAVRVMTIHKAKGLDFVHTYVVQLHKGSGGRGGAASADARVGTHAGHFEFELLGAATPGHHHVVRQSERVAAAERIRTLYVAMTRARDRLVLVGSWPTKDVDVTPATAQSHLDLLGLRGSGIPDLLEAMGSLAAMGSSFVFVEDGVSWHFPALATGGAAEAARPGTDAVTWPSLDAIRAESRALLAHRRSARARSAQPWSAAPSAEPETGATGLPHPAPTPDAARSASDPSGRAARLAGTVIHRILEDFDLRADPDDEVAAQRARLPDLVHALSREPVPPELAVASVELANDVLDVLAGGTLLPRLRALVDREIWRELPVLLPPGAEGGGAVGFSAGIIDLCYRDPHTDEWVVADFKTDRVESEVDLLQKVEHYTEQGRFYARAIREALDLDRNPRFELWFVRADRVAVVE